VRGSHREVDIAVLVSCARSEGERYQAASAHLSGQKLIFLDLKNAPSPRSGLGSL
jgi:hypothetical protein